MYVCRTYIRTTYGSLFGNICHLLGAVTLLKVVEKAGKVTFMFEEVVRVKRKRVCGKKFVSNILLSKLRKQIISSVSKSYSNKIMPQNHLHI